MILYGRPLTVGSFAAIMALEECEVEFEVEWQEPGAPADALAAMHPLGTLPFLALEGERGIANALVIVRYLERRFPSAWHRPASGKEAARAGWVAEFALDEIGPAAAEFFHGTVVAPAVGLDVNQDRMREAWGWIASPQERLGDRSRFDILEEKATSGWFNTSDIGAAGIAVSAALARPSWAGRRAFRSAPSCWPARCAARP